MLGMLNWRFWLRYYQYTVWIQIISYLCLLVLWKHLAFRTNTYHRFEWSNWSFSLLIKLTSNLEQINSKHSPINSWLVTWEYIWIWFSTICPCCAISVGYYCISLQFRSAPSCFLQGHEDMAFLCVCGSESVRKLWWLWFNCFLKLCCGYVFYLHCCLVKWTAL